MGDDQLRHLRRIAGATAEGETTPSLPPNQETLTAVSRLDVPVGSAPAPLRLHHLELGEVLGRGGMGVVYRAYDPNLRRQVAVKVLGAADRANPVMIDRFWREARTAGSLHHPGIVAVHEVGVHDGSPYVVMDLVDGVPLSARLAEGEAWPLRERILLLREISRAVEHAHAHGVVHRDLKPSNIMVDRTGRPLVLDFGLARRMDADRVITVSGQLLGTPGYMAPEQVDGESALLGPHSDVFSLGAILYEMLTGSRAVPGATMADVFRNTLRGDVVPPRRLRPSVPIDLDTVCLRCLETDLAKRYRSAGLLADELDRWLEGEPIQARPISPLSRVLRKALRHKTVVLPTAIALALCAAIAGWSAVTHREMESARERDRSELAGKEAELAVQADTLRKAQLVGAVLLRWGMLASSLQDLERIYFDSTLSRDDGAAAAVPVWSRFAAFIAETPGDDASQSAMWALAGWARCFAFHAEEGLAWCRHARALDRDIPYGALMEAMVRFTDAVQTLELPEVILTKTTGFRLGSVRPETPEEAERRGRIEVLLAEAEQAVVWGKEGVRDFAAALAAIRAWQAGAYDQAEASFGQALARSNPCPFPADLRIARSKMRFVLHDFAGALEDLAEVAKARPRSGTPPLQRSHVKQGRAAEMFGRGEDPRALLREAIGDAEEALKWQPGAFAAYSARAWGYWSLGNAEEARGEDPRDSFGKSIEDYGRVLERQVIAVIHADRGRAEVSMGAAESARGLDPHRWLERAVADCAEALRLDPGSVTALQIRGGAHIELARWDRARGADAQGFAAKAIADYDEILRHDPGVVLALARRARARMGLGLDAMNRGGDPLPIYEAALRDLDEAIRLDPECLDALSDRPSVFRYLGDADRARGRDPRPNYQRAIADYAEAEKHSPPSASLLSKRATACALLGDAVGERGEDPRIWYAQAIAVGTEALRLNPGARAAHLALALAHFRIGNLQAANGQSPREDHERCLALCGEAIRHNPTDLDGRFLRAEVLLEIGGAQAGAAGDPRPNYEQAIADLTEIVERAPNSARARASRGAALLHLGVAESARGDDARARYRAALEDLDRAVMLLPDDPVTRLHRGNVWVSLARAETARGEDPCASLERAIADFGAALERSAGAGTADRLTLAMVLGRAEAWCDLGRALAQRGEDPRESLDRSAADFDAVWPAAAVRPDALLARARLHRCRAQAAARRGADPRADREQALADLEAAAKADPRSRAARVEQAAVCREAGDLDAAIRASEAALEIAGEALAGAAACDLADLVAFRAAALAESDPAEAARGRDRAFGILERAVGSGWRDLDRMDRDPDLASLRGDLRWADLRTRAGQ